MLTFANVELLKMTLTVFLLQSHNFSKPSTNILERQRQEKPWWKLQV